MVSSTFGSKWYCFFRCYDGLVRDMKIFIHSQDLSLAVRFILAFDPFLQVQCKLSIANAGTISLVLSALISCAFFFGANFHSTLVSRCAYQFSPWIVFIIFLWGVVENNWIPKTPTRNNIIAAVELIGTLVSAIVALVLFSMRYRASKIDPIA